jgi:hypothetical protein
MRRALDDRYGYLRRRDLERILAERAIQLIFSRPLIDLVLVSFGSKNILAGRR